MFFCYVVILSAFWFVIGLLQRGAIRHLVAAFYLRVGDSDGQNKFVQLKLIVVSMLNNLKHRYYSYYIIKFIGFMPIYYANLDIASSMIFSYLYS